MVPGIYGASSVVLAWMANNSEPYYRRATSVAIGLVATNAVCLFLHQLYLSLSLSTFLFIQGSILGTWSFPTSEGPKFRKTTIMSLIL